MSELIKIDENYYAKTSFSPKARKFSDDLESLMKRIEELQNLMAVMLRAKNGYIEDLKYEIMNQKVGLNHVMED